MALGRPKPDKGAAQYTNLKGTSPRPNWVPLGQQGSLGGTPGRRSPQQGISANVTIYTDGSATGVVMETTEGDSADPVIIQRSKIRGAELTPSYEEEKAGQLSH